MENIQIVCHINNLLLVHLFYCPTHCKIPISNYTLTNVSIFHSIKKALKSNSKVHFILAIKNNKSKYNYFIAAIDSAKETHHKGSFNKLSILIFKADLLFYETECSVETNTRSKLLILGSHRCIGHDHHFWQVSFWKFKWFIEYVIARLERLGKSIKAL